MSTAINSCNFTVVEYEDMVRKWLKGEQKVRKIHNKKNNVNKQTNLTVLSGAASQAAEVELRYCEQLPSYCEHLTTVTAALPTQNTVLSN